LKPIVVTKLMRWTDSFGFMVTKSQILH